MQYLKDKRFPKVVPKMKHNGEKALESKLKSKKNE